MFCSFCYNNGELLFFLPSQEAYISHSHAWSPDSHVTVNASILLDCHQHDIASLSLSCKYAARWQFLQWSLGIWRGLVPGPPQMPISLLWDGVIQWMQSALGICGFAIHRSRGLIICLMNPPSTAASQGSGEQNHSYKYGGSFTCWPPLAEAFFNFPVLSRQSIRGAINWVFCSFYFWLFNWNHYHLRLWKLDSEHEAS